MKKYKLNLYTWLLLILCFSFFTYRIIGLHISKKQNIAPTKIIIFKENEINLGNIKMDSLYPVQFVFQLAQGQKSNAFNFVPSCGCTVINGDWKRILHSNRKDTLQAVVNTQGKHGHFLSYISAIDDKGNFIDSLKVIGNVQ